MSKMQSSALPSDNHSPEMETRVEVVPLEEPTTPLPTPGAEPEISGVREPSSPTSSKEPDVHVRRLSSKSGSLPSYKSPSRTNTDLRTASTPQKLGRKGATHVVMLIGDVLLSLFPVSFLVLAGMTGTLSGKPVSEFGQRIAQWSLFGPTIFPIFFAGIVGRTMKFIAGYRLERGASIESLEQLIGSQSVFGAIFTQVVLQKFGILSLCIMLVWAFSPLGGQASLRILYTEYQNITSTSEVAYLNMTSQLSGFIAGYSQSDSVYAIDALYASCLLSPESIKTGSQDSWGNVKIPQMKALNSTPDANGWMAVDNTGNVTYSSLLGIPVAGIPKDQNSTFNLHSSYYDVSCSNIHAFPAVGDWLSPLNISWASGYNTTTIFSAKAGSASFFLGSNTNSSNARTYGNDTSPVELVFLSRSGLNDSGGLMNVTMATCSLDISFVESRVDCMGQSCGVSSIRNDTPVYEVPKGWWWETAAPLMLGFSETMSFFIYNLEQATIPTTIYQSTPTEHYLYGEEFYPFSYGSEVVPLYTVALPDFSRRLTQIVNTYWLSSLGPEASTGNLPSNVTELLSGKGDIQGNFFPFSANATSATLSHLQEVYACSAPWLAVLVVASILLFVLGVAGTIMRYATLGPDVLGYVGSQVADSPYVVRDEDGNSVGLGVNSALDGLHRTKAMRGLRVRLEDVREKEDVGYVAISTMRGRAEADRKLRGGRLYA